MGYLKEKYTKEYYTGLDKNGNKLNYGATSNFDEQGNYILRDHDKRILEAVDFDGMNVLALGCGRGEELVYAINNGANSANSVGVDFSSAAIKICKKLVKERKIKSPQLFVEDALSFVSRFQQIVKDDKDKKFDIVIMFDFVEHVPRFELIKVLKGLKSLIKDNALLVVNTPAYNYDNDIIKNGYDKRNQFNLLDTSDNIPETKGMHCNKYSLNSLQNFMSEQGYLNVTEVHYFVNSEAVSDNFENISYHDRWSQALSLGIALSGDYRDDVIEIPYKDLLDIKLLDFNEGNLEGISIFTTDNYKDAAFKNGNTDPEMMFNINQLNPLGKTIFDVGTFMGTSAMLFSKMVGKDGKVIGFEPNSFNRNRSFKNISHNPKLSSAIEVYKFALGNDNKKQKMYLSSNIDIGHSSTSRLKGSHSTIHDLELPGGFEDVYVQVKTLDSFVDEMNVSPDIIKVDIEGAEYDFLLGSYRTIQKYHPILYIELHSQFCASRCTEFLILEGYSIEVLHEEIDNRLMIKAEFISEIQSRSVKENNIFMMNIINNINSSNRLLINNLEVLEKELAVLTLVKADNYKLTIENSSLILQNNNLLIDNSNLSSIIDDVKISKSWKVTRFFRFFGDVLRKIHKSRLVK